MQEIYLRSLIGKHWNDNTVKENGLNCHKRRKLGAAQKMQKKVADTLFNVYWDLHPRQLQKDLFLPRKSNVKEDLPRKAYFNL